MHSGSESIAKNLRLLRVPLASSWQWHGRMSDSSEIIHWTLYRADRRLTCIERLMPSGSECSVLYNGLPVAVRMLAMGRDVDAWAAEVRSAWESAGWLTDSCDAASSDAASSGDASSAASNTARSTVESAHDASEDVPEYATATARLRVAW
jgi:hypothetical protein